MKNNDIQGNRQLFLCTVSLLTFSSDDYTEVAKLIAEAAGMQALDWATHSYPVQGGTYIWFLGESHIAIDTYPEYNLAEITLVSCKSFETDKLIKVIMDAGWVIRDYSTICKNKDHAWQRC